MMKKIYTFLLALIYTVNIHATDSYADGILTIDITTGGQLGPVTMPTPSDGKIKTILDSYSKTATDVTELVINFSGNINLTAPDFTAIRTLTNLVSLDLSSAPKFATAGFGSLSGMLNLETVILPAPTTSANYAISGTSFTGCSKLTYVGTESAIGLPSNVTEIKSGAFTGCTAFADKLPVSAACATIASIPPGGVVVDAANPNYSSAANGTLLNKAGTELVLVPANAIVAGAYTLPSTVTKVGNSAFSGNTTLTSIALSNVLETIGEYAFEKSGLTSITIPGSVTSIGKSAFSTCNNLATIVFESSANALSIGNNAFESTKLTAYPLPARTTSIGTYLFSKCTSLTTANMSNLSVQVNNGMFSGCSELASVTLSANATSIPNQTFENCSKLTALTIPATVTNIGTAFSKAPCLLSVENGNTRYSAEGGNLYSLAKDTIYYVPYNGTGTFTAPASLKVVKGSVFQYAEFSGLDFSSAPSFHWALASAFSGMPNLISANFTGTALDSIEGNLFKESAKLETVTFPDNSLRFLPAGTFQSCSKLNNFVIPSSVIGIADAAFRLCPSLTSIIIPAGVTSIGNNTFGGCTGLTSIIALPSTPPVATASTFTGITYSNVTLTVSSEDAKTAYSTPTGWSLFTNVVVDPNIITSSKAISTSGWSYEMNNGQLVLSGVKSASVIIYNTAGICVYNAVVDGDATINLLHGMYILSVGKERIKIAM